VPRLTIVIPALGDVESFETTILSVLESRPEDCEILVPQCGDYADPYHLSDEVVFLEQPAAASGVELWNTGVNEAQGEIIHLLGAGATVTEGWTEAPLRRFDDRLLGTVTPLLLTADQRRITALGLAYGAGGTRHLAGCGKKFHADRPLRSKAVGPTAFAGFYRRAALEEAGGWQASVGDQLADLDLALSLAALGWTTCCEPQSKVLLDPAYLELERSFAEAWNAERLFWRHAPASGWLKSLLMHSLAMAWESARSLPNSTALTQPLARLLAACELPRHLRFHRQMQQAIMQEPAASEGDGRAMILPLHRFDDQDTPDDRPLRRVS
jgi:hypothetical protein